MYTQFIDYALFFAFLIGSTLYPLWGGLRRNNKDTKANYVFAAGQVSVFAMMLSIARGTLGVRAFLGKYIYIFIYFSFLSESSLRFVCCAKQQFNIHHSLRYLFVSLIHIFHLEYEVARVSILRIATI